eukprot:6427052-Prymnesium_polylepis.1
MTSTAHRRTSYIPTQHIHPAPHTHTPVCDACAECPGWGAERHPVLFAYYERVRVCRVRDWAFFVCRARKTRGPQTAHAAVHVYRSRPYGLVCYIGTM